MKEWILSMRDNTILSGKAKDESFMHGILNRVRDLNLKLISVNTAIQDNNKQYIN